VKKKERGVRFYVWVGGLFLAIFSFCLFFYFKSWDEKSDYLLVSLGKEEMHIINFSPDREAVNWYVLDSKISVLVPSGYGWYPVSSLAGLIDQENQPELISDLLFINFGLVADRIVVGSFGQVKNLRDLLSYSKIGLIDTWKLRAFGSRNYSPDRRYLREGLVELEDGKRTIDRSWWLGNWVKDISDSKIVEEDFDFEVLNEGARNGAALRMGELILMSGLNLHRVDDFWSDRETDRGTCRMEYLKENKDSVFLADFRKMAQGRVEFVEQEGLETDFRLVITENCFLDVEG
jgi:hypothetical protein